MRKLLAILIALMLLGGVVGNASAVTWHTTNQATVAWGAVTTDIDGDPITAGATVVYDVFYVAYDSSDFDTDKVFVTGTNALQQVVAFPKGKWFVGVRAVLIDDADLTELARSAFAWSANPLDCLNNVDFGLRYYVNLNKVSGLNRVLSP